MKKQALKIGKRLLAFALSLMVFGSAYIASAQDIRWIRVGQTQSFFVDYGSECELNNFFAWPAQYGDNQTTCRAKGLWIGATNFYDPVEKKVKSVKVIGSGPRYDPINQPLMIFPQSIKLIGRSNPPVVTPASINQLYDTLDEVDPNLPCERMVVINYNTSMGVSVTKRVLAFVQQNHDNYFIHDYVFKNTGIYNTAGDTIQQTLNDFWVFFNYRYAFAGVTSTGYGSTWGDFSSEWGASTESDDFGPPLRARPDSLRGFYAFYSPLKGGARDPVSSLGYDYDWGCPKYNGGGENLDGLLGSAKYAGCVTLLASKDPGNFNVDDYNQPATVNYFSADGATTQTPTSQYDESFMGLRWAQITEGHLPQSLWQAVGDQRFYADWLGTDSLHPSGGEMGQGYGPYTLAPGDSIHIVFAEGASGISWEKCREVGANWYAYYTATGTPTLIKPDGSQTTSYSDYQRAWVRSGIDSIIQAYKSARANYKSGYNIPKPPPAPNQFTVESGGDRIHLTWANNADSWSNFDGYVIYRSEGIVKDYRTIYNKVFECNASNVVHLWYDTTTQSGIDYYYYIQSKDNGTQNELHPGTPLYSSMFLTMTNTPASSITSVAENKADIPTEFSLRQNFPNPFNPSTTISFDLPSKLFVSLKVFDLMGREVATIVSEELSAGNYSRQWNAQGLSSGIYFYRMQAGSFIETKKLLLLK